LQLSADRKSNHLSVVVKSLANPACLNSVRTSKSSASARSTLSPQNSGSGQLTQAALAELEGQPARSSTFVQDRRPEKASQLRAAFRDMGAEIPEWMLEKMAKDTMMQTCDGNYSGRGGYN
jgi:hypothetical protein